jgi:hypothetical protein
MITRWETDKDKIKRYLKVSPRKKLQMLEEMRLFFLKYTSQRTKKISKQLNKA